MYKNMAKRKGIMLRPNQVVVLMIRKPIIIRFVVSMFILNIELAYPKIVYLIMENLGIRL